MTVGGRLVVISFHSLEDRPVKRLLQKEAKGDDFPPDLPIRADQIKPRIRLVGKPVRAGAGELETNRRARSAIMRVAEKVRA
jgi:16S rRNA (cytosine1402-N4)-methyltransferase